MKKEDLVNIDLDVYNVLKEYEGRQDTAFIFLRAYDDGNRIDASNIVGGGIDPLHHSIIASMEDNTELKDLILNSFLNYLRDKPDELDELHETLTNIKEGNTNFPTTNLYNED